MGSEFNRQAQARAVIETAKELLNEGLVARTWGNLSARVSADHFLITPSGRDYRQLLATDLVDVDLEGIWDGARKPSSEKGIHALIYKARLDAKFIVHTHQPYASAISLGKEAFDLPAELAELLGSATLPIASYGLPGTKALHKAMIAQVQATGSRAILMRAHGLMAFGEDAAEALKIAQAVEKFARSVYLKRVKIVPEDTPEAGEAGSGSGNCKLTAERLWTRANLATPSRKKSEDDDAGALVREDKVRAEVAALFAARPEVQCIIGESDPAVMAHSTGLKPYLDDYSQLIGLRAGTVKETVTQAQGLVHGKLLKVLGKAGVPDMGKANVAFGEYAYCMGKDAEEAEAIQMVLHKNALAASFARTYAVKPLKQADALLQRSVYALKYSKLKDK